MEQLQKWFASSPVASFLRHFFAILISLAVADFSRLGHFDFGNFETWVIAALVSAIPPFLRWLNPMDELG